MPCSASRSLMVGASGEVWLKLIFSFATWRASVQVGPVSPPPSCYYHDSFHPREDRPMNFFKRLFGKKADAPQESLIFILLLSAPKIFERDALEALARKAWLADFGP